MTFTSPPMCTCENSYRRLWKKIRAATILSMMPLSALASQGQTPNELDSFIETFPAHLTQVKMIKIPDGEAKLGDTTVKIKNLYFSETEIPWEVFEIFSLRLDQSAEEIARDPQGKGADATTRPSRPYAAIFIGFGHHTFPAICMSSFNAEEFCKWLSARSGKKYRLPTAAEWAYANARTEAPTEKTAWCWESADDTTHPVTSLSANSNGLKNMTGNVAEWVQMSTDPEKKYGVMGGSWKDKIANLAPQPNLFRPYDPKWNDADPQNPKSRWWLANGQFIGLRLVCER